MPINDSLLFIDSNKYLDLYRIDKGKKLLTPLVEQIDYIFITQQVANEVQRNKIIVATDFLRKKSKELKLQTLNLPDHLSDASADEKRKNILQGMSEVTQKIKTMNAEVDALVLDSIQQISRSEDEVSRALDQIFARAISHSPEELLRARDRRELGNPPGKIANPIGDQLTWEQILTHFKEKKRLWIISRDGDYGTVYGGKGFPNRFLCDELSKITCNPEVYLFEDIVEGINHFVDLTGAKADQRLTPEEVEEITREEKALPYSYQPNESFQKAIENITRSNDSVRKAIESMAVPNESFQQSTESIGDHSQLDYRLPRMLEKLQQPLTQAQPIIDNTQREANKTAQDLRSLIGENENNSEDEEEIT